jgi:hypothetical protein
MKSSDGSMKSEMLHRRKFESDRDPGKAAGSGVDF